MRATAGARLADVRVAFGESLVAWQAALAAGLPATARLRSTSPALLLSGRPGVEQFDRRLTPDWLRRYRAAILPFAERLFLDARRSAEAEPWALHMARAGTLYAHRLVIRAACLEAADFHEPRALLALGGRANLRRTPPLDRLLGNNPGFLCFEAESPNAPEPRRRADRWSALRVAGLEGVAYRLLLKLWRQLPARWAQAEVLILSDNELLQEAAVRLGLGGAALRVVTLPAAAPMAMPQVLKAALLQVTAKAVDDFARAWVPAAAVRPCREAFEGYVCDQVEPELGCQDAVARRLDALLGDRPTVALTNYPGLPERMAAIRHLRKRGVPVIGFQHGVSREINGMLDAAAAYTENAATDLFLAYNERAAAVANGQPFAGGRSEAVGLPRRMTRAGRAPFWRRRTAIWYVSTNSYRGVWQSVAAAISDREKAQREIAIVEEVLGRLDRPVVYKPYPEASYADPDPVLEHLSRYPNISVHGDAVDLRYLFPHVGLIVTARATSTTAWCLMSGRPVVFLDLPDDQPLHVDVRGHFAAGLFLFDGTDPAERERLHNFLKQPLSVITKAWAEKAAARQALIGRYFSAGGRPGAGAAELIEGWLRQRPPRQAANGRREQGAQHDG